jgi:hypothetical protein
MPNELLKIATNDFEDFHAIVSLHNKLCFRKYRSQMGFSGNQRV